MEAASRRRQCGFEGAVSPTEDSSFATTRSATAPVAPCALPRLPASLRALVVFDEVYAYAPPHPANPPAKRPLMALMKQARACGVGVVLATQKPMVLGSQ